MLIRISSIASLLAPYFCRYAATAATPRRRVLVAVLVVLFLQLGVDADEVVGSRYELPPWAEAVKATDVERYATAGEYDAAASDPAYVLETVRYPSDGLRVVAYLYRPAEESAPRPVVVFNRGSYVRGDVAPELLTTFHRLAEAGFTVVAPMYRGSAGGEGRDEMGGADLADLMNVAGLWDELGAVDRDDVFLYGESRGGMMVLQAIRDGFPARAAATYGAFTDLAEVVSTPEGAGMAAAIWPDFTERRGEILERRSAVRWVESLDLPLLLMHGADDASMPPAHTLTLALALSEAGRTPGVWIVPGAGHTLEEVRQERDRRAAEHFRRHMAGAD